MGKMSMLKNNELYSCVAENKLPNQKKEKHFLYLHKTFLWRLNRRLYTVSTTYSLKATTIFVVGCLRFNRYLTVIQNSCISSYCYVFVVI